MILNKWIYKNNRVIWQFSVVCCLFILFSCGDNISNYNVKKIVELSDDEYNLTIHSKDTIFKDSINKFLIEYKHLKDTLSDSPRLVSRDISFKFNKVKVGLSDYVFNELKFTDSVFNNLKPDRLFYENLTFNSEGKFLIDGVLEDNLLIELKNDSTKVRLVEHKYRLRFYLTVIDCNL